MNNTELLTTAEELLFQVEAHLTELDAPSLTTSHVQHLVVIRQFMYGLVWELNVVVRTSPTTFH